jgi:carboxyl-terminal processing protease
MENKPFAGFSYRRKLRDLNPFFWISLVVIFTSCRKESDEPLLLTKGKEESFTALFNEFWGKMNSNYVMWDVDTTDWNRLYNSYAPLFAELRLNRTADRLLAAHYFRQMVKGLSDAHYMITFRDSLLKDSSITPADSRLKQRLHYHLPYDEGYFDRVAQRYLDADYYTASYHIDRNYLLNYIAGTIQQHTLYFRLNGFAIYRVFHSDNNRMKALLNFVFDRIKEENTRGIIIDLRDNRGGDLYDLNYFAGRFIDKPLLYGFSRYKSSSQPVDYSPWMPALITPLPGSKAFTKKIVLLTNLYSASVAELTSMALKALPNTIVIGERTYGANGLLTSEIDLSSGSFNIGDFADIKTASAIFKYKDGRIYEGVGFPPDIEIPYKALSATKSVDEQLEAAIRLCAVSGHSP